MQKSHSAQIEASRRALQLKAGATNTTASANQPEPQFPALNSINNTAATLDKSTTTVWRLIWGGHLDVVYIGRSPMVTGESLARLAREGTGGKPLPQRKSEVVDAA